MLAQFRVILLVLPPIKSQTTGSSPWTLPFSFVTAFMNASQDTPICVPNPNPTSFSPTKNSSLYHHLKIFISFLPNLHRQGRVWNSLQGSGQDKWHQCGHQSHPSHRAGQGGFQANTAGDRLPRRLQPPQRRALPGTHA